MTKLLKEPTVRLFGRALAAAILTCIVDLKTTGGGQLAWQSLAVGAGLAFCEVFTPLNGLVGLFKQEDVPRG